MMVPPHLSILLILSDGMRVPSTQNLRQHKLQPYSGILRGHSFLFCSGLLHNIVKNKIDRTFPGHIHRFFYWLRLTLAVDARRILNPSHKGRCFVLRASGS